MPQDDFCGPVKLGNPNEFRVRELAERVLDITGSSSRLVEKPLPADDPKLRKTDITLASTVLGWTLKVQLKDGFRQTVNYFDKLLGINSGPELQSAWEVLPGLATGIVKPAGLGR